MKYFITIFLVFSGNLLLGQEIFDSLKAADYQELRKQLEDPAQAEQYNENGLTPLWMAVFKKDSTAVKILLENGAAVDGLSKNGMPPIMVGAMVNAMESVKLLLEHGANVNWKSPASRNQQPIRFASRKGTVAFIKFLIASGADIEATADDGGTPLITAVYSNNYELAKFYFEQGAEVNILARDGECIIHEAINTKNPLMVELALQYNCPLNYKDAKGRSTMEIANASGNKSIKKMIKNALK